MHTALYIKVIAILFTIAIGVPLLLFPLKWGRMLRWSIPDDTRLTVYFGRCLGAVVVSISIVFLRFADNMALHAAMLEMLLYAFSLITLVHMWGFIRRTQPWTEHAEIPIYLGLAIYTYILRFAG